MSKFHRVQKGSIISQKHGVLMGEDFPKFCDFAFFQSAKETLENRLSFENDVS